MSVCRSYSSNRPRDDSAHRGQMQVTVGGESETSAAPDGSVYTVWVRHLRAARRVVLSDLSDQSDLSDRSDSSGLSDRSDPGRAAASAARQVPAGQRPEVLSSSRQSRSANPERHMPPQISACRSLRVAATERGLPGCTSLSRFLWRPGGTRSVASGNLSFELWHLTLRPRAVYGLTRAPFAVIIASSCCVCGTVGRIPFPLLWRPSP